MTFDPGGEAIETLTVQAIDMMLGLMQLRGWRRHGQDMTIGLARDRTDRWWDHVLATHAFVIESELAPGADSADIERIADLTMIAWCMEREFHLGDATPRRGPRHPGVEHDPKAWPQPETIHGDPRFARMGREIALRRFPRIDDGCVELESERTRGSGWTRRRRTPRAAAPASRRAEVRGGVMHRCRFRVATPFVIGRVGATPAPTPSARNPRIRSRRLRRAAPHAQPLVRAASSAMPESVSGATGGSPRKVTRLRAVLATAPKTSSTRFATS